MEARGKGQGSGERAREGGSREVYGSDGRGERVAVDASPSAVAGGGGGGPGGEDAAGVVGDRGLEREEGSKVGG